MIWHKILLQNFKEQVLFGWNVESDVLLLIAFNALHLASKRRELVKELGPGLDLKYDHRSSNSFVPESFLQLKVFQYDFLSVMLLI